MFDIKTSRDFYEKLLEDLGDLQGHSASARHAINCAITAYHMHEWVWGDWLNKDYATWNKLGIRDKDTFVKWIDENEPWFRVVQDIANGSKHFNRGVSQQTKASGVSDLDIEIDVDGKKSWIPADILIETVILFWKNFLLDYSPYASDLPDSRVYLTEFK